MPEKSRTGAYDWQKYPSGWSYKSTKDTQYIKDRDDLFRKHGNGWWISDGVIRLYKGAKK